MFLGIYFRVKVFSRWCFLLIARMFLFVGNFFPSFCYFFSAAKLFFSFNVKYYSCRGTFFIHSGFFSLWRHFLLGSCWVLFLSGKCFLHGEIFFLFIVRNLIMYMNYWSKSCCVYLDVSIRSKVQYIYDEMGMVPTAQLTHNVSLTFTKGYTLVVKF